MQNWPVSLKISDVVRCSRRQGVDLSKICPGLGKTRFLTALVVVALINAALFVWQPAATVNAADLPSKHTWEWWRTRSYVKQVVPPNLVLLGSSLVMIPISMVDADYLNEVIDPVHHDRCIYMESLLNQTNKTKGATAFNFAIPGGMVSDDYMIVRALMSDSGHPKLIVLGLTLRDFIDSHVQCAASTCTFQYFRRFFNVDDIVNLSMPEFWQRLDYWSGKSIYILGKRLDLQVDFAQLIAAFYQHALGSATSHPVLDQPTLTANVARNLKSEAEEGDFLLTPKQAFPFEDNSAEYRKRFHNPSAKLFSAESTFLEKFLALAKQMKIQVLLVNMPLTASNMAIMPTGYYPRYLQVLSLAAQKYGCPLLDLNSGKQFELSDFRDTAHMNASGGKKLVDAIVAQISADKQIKMALDESGPGFAHTPPTPPIAGNTGSL